MLTTDEENGLKLIAKIYKWPESEYEFVRNFAQNITRAAYDRGVASVEYDDTGRE